MLRLAALLLTAFLCANAQTINLTVDASDAARRLFHAKMTMAVTPGELALTYPEWIPGNHRPTGPIADVVWIRMTANGRDLTWRRDPVDLYKIYVTVPSGVTSMDVAFDLIAPPSAGWSSQFLATLSWNSVLMYPAGKPSDAVNFKATLKVPAEWRYGTALPIARESSETVEFETASLTTVVDSPIIMGRYFKTFDLSPGQSPAHYLHVAADSAAALNASDEKIETLRRLVKETGAAFGSRHYRSYHFLLALSEQVATGGLEHHESSDNKMRENYFLDDALWRNSSTLWHEMAHSWNGKFRRPEGLATGDFHEPMDGELLWVYEGMTRYLGDLFAARTGLWTTQQWMQRLAMLSANLASTTGRDWRPLADTATSVSILNGARADWRHLRRSTDYYDEGSLIWLEADVLIRRESRGQKSLDTFYASFFGGPGGKPELKPYAAQELYAALNAVQPYDWRGFFQKRVYDVAPLIPLGGITGGGWKLVYRDQATDMFRVSETAAGGVNQLYSAGWTLNATGVITDIMEDSPADRAKLAPQMQIIAVNGRQYSAAGIRAAIREAKTGAAAIQLIVKSGDFYSVHALDCHTGERFPDLERDSAMPDLLSEIAKPRAK
ncbi:MAG: M61 family peptidase [Acidobacteriota bacterium]